MRGGGDSDQLPGICENVTDTELGWLRLRVRTEGSPVGSIKPGHAEGLEHHHDDEGQSGGVIIEHRHKVAPAALGKEQADHKANDAAEDCNKKTETEFLQVL